MYHQLSQALEATWRDRYGPDEDLPTEQEIVQKFNVSRITVRRALDEMMADGTIWRPKTRGRLRWAPVKLKHHVNRLRGFFSDDALASGHRPSARVIEVAQGIWTTANRYLHLPEEAPCYRISRLHESDGRPLSYQVSFIPCDVCPDLLLSDLSGSLLQMLESRYGHVVDHAEQRLLVREATAEEANLLQLPLRSNVFEVDRVSYAQGGRPVEYFTAALDVTRYEFVSSMDALRPEDLLAPRSPWGR
ncbi:GntR family transcriptional regulator [Limobrevibacterium gyesilva]|uniref:GntR family transcriptional regulator n=1 Tax=Limobrevibacterium gyesilva TaxID=2991712 RepID=UPI002226CA46|nr:GntR family transcriptional regulator [Limobrevibacterium gyesilva]